VDLISCLEIAYRGTGGDDAKVHSGADDPSPESLSFGDDVLYRQHSLEPQRLRGYSVMIRSAHSTNDTKIVGLPNFAFQGAKSVSVTLRARLHAPQA
jgi:hypothetical protein